MKTFAEALLFTNRSDQNWAWAYENYSGVTPGNFPTVVQQNMIALRPCRRYSPVFEKAKEDRVDNSHDSHGKVVVPGSPRYTEMDVLHVIRNGVNLAVLLGDDNAALIEIQNDYKDLLIRDHPKRTSAKDDTRELQDDVIKLELAVRDQRLKRQLAEDKVATAKADAEAERYAAEAEEIAEKRKRKRGQPMKLMRAKPRESEKGEKDANFGSGRGVQATNQAPNPSR